MGVALLGWFLLGCLPLLSAMLGLLLTGSYALASGWFAVGYAVDVRAAVSTSGLEVPGFGDALGHVRVADFGEDVVVELGPGGPFSSAWPFGPAASIPFEVSGTSRSGVSGYFRAAVC